MSTLTHNTCANICFAPSHSQEAEATPLSVSLLSFHLYMSNFCLSFSYGRSEKALPSCHISEQMKPALTAENMPIPTYPTQNGV